MNPRTNCTGIPTPFYLLWVGVCDFLAFSWHISGVFLAFLLALLPAYFWRVTTLSTNDLKTAKESTPILKMETVVLTFLMLVLRFPFCMEIVILLILPLSEGET